ncbi:MAG: HNH endonuclease [Phycisphaerae bacterium]|nr:HNH endonuclease [Phycisphaerae bacterium]
MEREQQQLSGRDTNTPTDASQVCSTVGLALNRDENLSEQTSETPDNSPDENLRQRTGGLEARVFVLNTDDRPLMPCTPAKARHLLDDKRAEVLSVKPFTIRLKFECENEVQPISLGIDSGYKTVGFSAVTDRAELMSGELKLRSDVSRKLKDRRMYRQNKRNRLWYRQPRFNNRTKNRKENWLPPSIQHKVDTHIRLIDRLKSILPISEVTVEVAKFDAQKLQDADIEGIGYQEGQMQGHDNLRAFILYRDRHTCQICNRKGGMMNIHHIVRKTDGGSDRPDNLVTVHKTCHDKFHRGNIEYAFKKPESFRQAVLMNNIRKYVADRIDCNHTYGHITKRQRINIGLGKSHVNDAFVIADGDRQDRCRQSAVRQVRRNNRCLQKNRKGFKPAIRRQRYRYQPNDSVLIANKRYVVKGTHCRGSHVMVSDGLSKSKSIKVDMLGSQVYRQGISFEEQTSIHPTFKKVGFLEVVI